MSRFPFYCSELSREVAEKSYGTASVGDVWLLVEYPYAWGARALQDSALPAAVKARLSKILKTIPRVKLLFIKRDRPPQDFFTFFIVRCRESGPDVVKFQLEIFERLLSIDIASVAAGNSLAGGTVADRPLLLVCTHGKRDKCCAKFGYPLYKSLRDQTAELVWQSSHVGGDRFAANLICFPHGLFFAHVTGQDGKFISHEYERRRLVLEKYRGRACYAHPVQAAEYFIRKESGLIGIDDLRHLGCQRLGDETWKASFIAQASGTVHEAQITSRLSEFRNQMTCHSTEEKRVPQYILDSYRTIS